MVETLAIHPKPLTFNPTGVSNTAPQQTARERGRIKTGAIRPTLHALRPPHLLTLHQPCQRLCWRWVGHPLEARACVPVCVPWYVLRGALLCMKA